MTFRSAKTSIFFDARLIPRSTRVPGEVPPAGEVRPGELAVNTADGTLFVGGLDGTASRFAQSDDLRRVVVMTQSEYDAITAAGTVEATTLYVVTAQ